MFQDRTIERRVKARMQRKIEEAQKRYEDEKRAIIDRHEAERMAAWQAYMDALEKLDVTRHNALVDLEEECVGDACKL